MIFNVIIILALLYGLYVGYRRGLALQTVHLVGYALSIIVAVKFYEPLAHIAELFIPFPALQQGSQLVLYDEAKSFYIDEAFYRAISFIAVAFLGWLFIQLISMLIKRRMEDSDYQLFNKIGGAIINLFTTYLVIFLGLFVLSLIPLEPIQQMFVDSPMAYSIVSSTPVVSDLAAESWLKVLPGNP